MDCSELEQAYQKLGCFESWNGSLLKEGRIGRNREPMISQAEFEAAIAKHSRLEFPGPHCYYNELTGEPVCQSRENIIYVVGYKNELGSIFYGGYSWIGVTNVPKEICVYLAVELKAELLPIYYL